LSTPPLGTPNAASPKSTEPCTSREIFFIPQRKLLVLLQCSTLAYCPQVPHLRLLSMSRLLLAS
jgi:hypothetical protein